MNEQHERALKAAAAVIRKGQAERLHGGGSAFLVPNEEWWELRNNLIPALQSLGLEYLLTGPEKPEKPQPVRSVPNVSSLRSYGPGDLPLRPR